MKIIGIHKEDKYKVIHNINKDWGNSSHFCLVEKEDDGKTMGIDPQDYNWIPKLSAYNEAHCNNDDCCGIFNITDNNLEIICSGCGKKLTEYINELILEEKDIVEVFRSMCEESINPDDYSTLVDNIIPMLQKNRLKQ